MKNIKIKAVLWIIALFTIVGSCIAQDTKIHEGDTYVLKADTVDNILIFALEDTINPYLEYQQQDIAPWEGTISVEVESSPLEVTLKSEPIEDNEALQSMLELETEQTDALNQNLSNLNRTVRDLPMLNIEAKQSVLNQYGLDPTDLEEKRSGILVIRWAIICILSAIAALFILNPTDNRLYRNKKYITRLVVLLGLGILSAFSLTEMAINWIPKYNLWENIERLF